MKTLQIKPPPKIHPQPLEDFLSRHGLVHGQWDLLLFGDGSGLGWEKGGGFASVLFDSRLGIRSHVVGAQTLTTVNRMELSAYVQSLAYHFECLLEGVVRDPPYRVFVFTDSELTAKGGRKDIVVRKNLDLWQCINWYEIQGYRISWRWVPRNSTPYHELADYLAGTARFAINAVNTDGSNLHSLMPYSVRFSEDAELSECPTCKTPLVAGADCPICGPTKET